MQGNSLTDIHHATPEWLTNVLADSGRLTKGQVLSVSPEKGTSPHSTNARLLISYSEVSAGECPESLFLKISRSVAEFGTSELEYYSKIAAQMTDPPIPTCYHADFSREVGAYHLLMQDLSASHEARWKGDPSLESATSAMDALAHLHAHWWNHPHLEQYVGSFPTRSTIEKYIAPAREGLAPFLEIGRAHV